MRNLDEIYDIILNTDDALVEKATELQFDTTSDKAMRKFYKILKKIGISEDEWYVWMAD